MGARNARIPETQARAHAELDAVVGGSRLPTFADLSHLPYIRAMVKEALRWRPIAPSGPPHQTTEDDWYEGTFIPKGTVCIPNVWHLKRDPRSLERTQSVLTRCGIPMQVGTLRPACPISRTGGISRMVLGAESRRSLHGRQRVLHQHCGLVMGGQNWAKERRIRQLRSFGFGWMGGLWPSRVSNLYHLPLGGR